MPRFSKYDVKCKLCNKPLEWYRGRPKTYCSKCLLIAQNKNSLKYYYKNREKKLAYGRKYADTHKEEKAIYSKEYFKDPVKKEERRIYMKNYNKRKRASKK
tara:strand:+ start:249 stop:551 length:303 start_codon:yes stop_codon:yes gene_type:complete